MTIGFLKIKFMSLRLGGALLLVAAAACQTSHAEELKWRNVSHVNETTAHVVPDSGGVTVGTGKGSGLGFFANDQVATVTLGFTIDYVKGEGTFLAYETYTFADSSTLVLKRRGETRNVRQGAEAHFKGDFDVVGGTGRYTGAKGRGTFVGRRLAPLSTGADQYFDYIADVTIPAKQ